MDPLTAVLAWFGGHWWIVFPLMGVAGGAAKAWERGAKRRHERRLETLRVKGEIKAAQFAARGQGGPKAPKDVASDSQLSSKELLERLFAEHDEILTGPDARSAKLLLLTEGASDWTARQIFDDPAGDHDWGLSATIDLAASDEAGEAVVTVTGVDRL